MSVTKSLVGAKVLVTRPQGQGEGLVAAIQREGGEASHYPVMLITALNSVVEPERVQRCKQLIMELDQFQQIIFISTNAVNFGMEWINQYWPQLPTGIHWHGIGNRTIEQLIAAGVPATSADDGAMNSEALLQHKSLQQLSRQKALIIRGVDGREYLAQQLSQRGATVSYAECYQRTLVEKPVGDINIVMERQAINALCVNSGESLQNLCVLIGRGHIDAVKRMLLVVPSARVAMMAREEGFKKITVADNASDKSIVAALLAAYEK
ncbi:MAG: uroporphyrinogen-III synthase [Pseudomonadales bacterium]